MNRIETVSSKVRPVKKLFIIGPEDTDRIIQIIMVTSYEIWGISNLILLNDETLFNANILRFVARHDPDVIINYSTCADETLKRSFKTCVYNGITDSETVRRFSTDLDLWDVVPPAMRSRIMEEPKKVFSTFDISPGPIGLLYSLHYGVANEDYKKTLEDSLFHDVEIDTFQSLDQFLEAFLDSHHNNYLHLAGGFSITSGNGTSIYEIDYNPGDLFNRKPTIIAGSMTNLSSIVYFWNMRATYPYNKTLWFPVELLDTVDLKVLKQSLGSFKYYCVFGGDDRISNLLRECNEDTYTKLTARTIIIEVTLMSGYLSSISRTFPS